MFGLFRRRTHSHADREVHWFGDDRLDRGLTIEEPIRPNWYKRKWRIIKLYNERGEERFKIWYDYKFVKSGGVFRWNDDQEFLCEERARQAMYCLVEEDIKVLSIMDHNSTVAHWP